MAIIGRRAPSRVDWGQGALGRPASCKDDVSRSHRITSPFFCVHRTVSTGDREVRWQMLRASWPSSVRDAYKNKDMSAGKMLLAQIKVSFSAPTPMSVSAPHPLYLFSLFVNLVWDATIHWYVSGQNTARRNQGFSAIKYHVTLRMCSTEHLNTAAASTKLHTSAMKRRTEESPELCPQMSTNPNFLFLKNWVHFQVF